ncbi:alanine racemase [Altererythrobacter sp. ZODW24]|uniref:alanine racemase n=1 Tax=Altererythrobacter sp. ZODW24 TaxID=2185142 RepID=UPI000DF7252B|nr:alanine racemase [Altererythrobacter sp. ZODW24]
MSAEAPAATLRLRLDEDALASNWQALDRLSGSAKAGAAVKAQAYGTGTAFAIPVLRDAGCETFYVAHWSEVADVADHVSAAQISVLHGPLTAADAAYARAIGALPVINSLHQAKLWLETGGGPCDLMVDTGINRLGLSMGDIADPLVSQLQVETLMSHLASADEHSDLNAVQLGRFGEAAAHISAKRLSLANSAGIALGADYAFDVTRPGLSLYGGVQRDELAGVIKQVVYPQAAIVQIRDLNAGDSVGYNATFTAERDMRVGVVSIGYADGFLRSWSGKATFEYKGQSLPLLGRVSMDMVVIDCSNAPGIEEGDWADIPYDLPAASANTGLSQYELLTVLGRRFQRIVPD